MRRSGKKRRAWVAVALIAAAALLVLPRLLGGGGHVSYCSAVVERGGLTVTFSFTGHMTAPNSQTITSGASSSVREVYVSANDQVSRGDRLLRLDNGTVLRADMDGEVTSLSVRKGDYVSAGKTLCVITDLNRLEVEISVDEYDVEAVSVGKQVSVRVVALEEDCEGVITAFNKQASTSAQVSSYTATIGVEAPEKALPGMQVEVTVVRQQAEDALLLPAEAVLFDEENLPYVYILDGKGNYAAMRIGVGITDGKTVQVTEHLSEGDTVYYPAKTTVQSMPMRMQSFGRGGN